MQPVSLNGLGIAPVSQTVCIVSETTAAAAVQNYHTVDYFLFQGSLEDQLSRLREYEEAVYQFKPHLEELERINQQIQVNIETI